MSGYYPDGVTGREYAIAGADGNMDIEDQKDFCTNDNCPSEGEEQYVTIVDAEYYGSDAWGSWTCEFCGTENEWEGSVPVEEQEYEPEDYMEAYREEY